jgi:hypothetical protein
MLPNAAKIRAKSQKQQWILSVIFPERPWLVHPEITLQTAVTT